MTTAWYVLVRLIRHRVPMKLWIFCSWFQSENSNCQLTQLTQSLFNNITQQTQNKSVRWMLLCRSHSIKMQKSRRLLVSTVFKQKLDQDSETNLTFPRIAVVNGGTQSLTSRDILSEKSIAILSPQRTCKYTEESITQVSPKQGIIRSSWHCDRYLLDFLAPPPPLPAFSPSPKFTLECQYLYMFIARRTSFALFSFLFGATASPFRQRNVSMCRNFRLIRFSVSAIHLLFSHRLGVSIFTQAFNISQRWDVKRAHPYRLWIMRFALHHRTQHTHSLMPTRATQATEKCRFYVLQTISNHFFPSPGLIPRSMWLVWHLFWCRFGLRASLSSSLYSCKYRNGTSKYAKQFSSMLQTAGEWDVKVGEKNRKHCQRNAFSITFPIRKISKCNIHVRNIFPSIIPHQNREQRWRVSTGSSFAALAVFVQSHCGVALNTETSIIFPFTWEKYFALFPEPRASFSYARTHCSMDAVVFWLTGWNKEGERRKHEFHQQQQLQKQISVHTSYRRCGSILSWYNPGAASATAVVIVTLFLSPFSDINIFLLHHISILVVWHQHHARIFNVRRYFIESFLLLVILMRVLPSHLLQIVNSIYSHGVRATRQQRQSPNLFIEVIQMCDDPTISLLYPTIKYVNKALYFTSCTFFTGILHTLLVLCATTVHCFNFQRTCSIRTYMRHDGLDFGERTVSTSALFVGSSEAEVYSRTLKINRIRFRWRCLHTRVQGSNLIYSIRRRTIVSTSFNDYRAYSVAVCCVRHIFR